MRAADIIADAKMTEATNCRGLSYRATTSVNSAGQRGITIRTLVSNRFVFRPSLTYGPARDKHFAIALRALNSERVSVIFQHVTRSEIRTSLFQS